MLSLFSTVSGKERTELALMGIDDLQTGVVSHSE
jgi:hypothetical protein